MASSLLILGYGRPDLLYKQILRISSLGQPFLVSLDGPKNSEDKNALESRDLALRLYREGTRGFDGLLISDFNLGCKKGVEKGISWAFTKAESLIILEDDVIPSSSFIRFMNIALDYYQNDPKIFLINSWNPFKNSLEEHDFSVYRSRCFSPWGWGTWKDRWAMRDLDLRFYSNKQSIRDLSALKEFNLSINFERFWNKKFMDCKKGYDTWDYQLLWSMWFQGMNSIMPTHKLSGNVGFDARATHTKRMIHHESIDRYQLSSEDAVKSYTISEDTLRNCEITVPKLDSEFEKFMYGIESDFSFWRTVKYLAKGVTTRILPL